MVVTERAIDYLRGGETRLVLRQTSHGDEFYLWPDGGVVSDAVAKRLLRRVDILPNAHGWKLMER